MGDEPNSKLLQKPPIPKEELAETSKDAPHSPNFYNLQSQCHQERKEHTSFSYIKIISLMIP